MNIKMRWVRDYAHHDAAPRSDSVKVAGEWCHLEFCQVIEVDEDSEPVLITEWQEVESPE